MSLAEAKRALIDLGFTDLESDVYLYLLEHPSSTGYRIAQGLGKLPPNVYKAIDSLEVKAAVLVEGGKSRTCRAVSPDELLAGLQTRFLEVKGRAKAELAGLRPRGEDHRIYSLNDRDQVYERAKSMLKSCTQVALLDVFPKPIEQLKDDLLALVERGGRVTAKVYEPLQIPGLDIWLNPAPDRIVDLVPGELLILIVDGQELLIAAFSPDGKVIRQALWTASPIVSYLYHASLSCEIELAATWSGLAEIQSFDELQTYLDSVRHLISPVQSANLAGLHPKFEDLFRVPGRAKIVDSLRGPVLGQND